MTSQPLSSPETATAPVKVVSEYVAPWALAKEEMPIHLVWEGGGEIDAIQVELPSEFRLADTLNVKEFEQKDNIVGDRRQKRA